MIMYWVFHEDQLNRVLDAYVQRNSAPQDDPQALRSCLTDFLTSHEFVGEGMVRELREDQQ